MAAVRDKGRGTYFFWSDWRGSEVSGLTYAAKGLWIDLLAAMADKTPQGVISGDLESLAVALGFPGPMATAWVQTYQHLIVELESKGVFSRGCDVDEDLEPDAIVNRRMYRERMKSQDVSEARSRAARIRWDREKVPAEGRVSMDEVRREIALAECKTDAKLCKGDAKSMQNGIDDRPENKGDSSILGVLHDAKTCYTPTQPTPTQPNQPQPMGVQGECIPESVGTTLAVLKPLSGKVVYERLCRATGDLGARATWWNEVVHCFRKARQLGVLDEHLQYIEAHGSGIRKPSNYMVKRVLASARELGIKVPDVPGEGQM